LKLKLELNNFLRYYLGDINTWLATKPITVPTTIGGLFELSELNLGYFDSYLYMGATPTFIAPSYIQ
jgi:hypothetical protein